MSEIRRIWRDLRVAEGAGGLAPEGWRVSKKTVESSVARQGPIRPPPPSPPGLLPICYAARPTGSASALAENSSNLHSASGPTADNAHLGRQQTTRSGYTPADASSRPFAARLTARGCGSRV